jgi:toluene monooxygenase system protein D
MWRLAVADGVGPVLEANETGRALIEAIRADNAEVVVIDRGAYLRVLVPRRCRLTRVAIQAKLGRAFRLPGDLELVMPSFKGAFTVTTDEAVWEAR